MTLQNQPLQAKQRYYWRILLIDDDEDDYVLVRQMLSEAREGKFTLEWAPSFQAGLARLEADPVFDAVIVDYDLGLHSGIEMIRELSTWPYPAPILLLTGRGTYEVDVEAMEAGAADYLNKEEVNAAFLERAVRYAIERKKHEMAMRESEERYRTLFNSMRNGFALHEILCDDDGHPVDYRFLEVNPTFELLTGLKADEIIGKTVREVLPGIEFTWIETYGKVALSGNPAEFENYSAPLDRYYQVYAFSPRLGQFATIFSDITGRKHIEEALRESEERFRALFNNRHSIMLVIDPVTIEIVDANPAARAYYGWDWDQLTRMKITDINTLPEQVIRKKMSQAQSSITGMVFQFRHRLASGDIRDVNVHSGPIRIREKEYLFSIVHDITDHKRTEEALYESEARYRTFFDNLHENVSIYRPVRNEQDEIIDWIYTDVNNLSLQMLGLERAQVVGKQASEILGADSVTTLFPIFSRVLAVGTSSILEMEYKDRLWMMTLFRLGADLVASTGLDITERKEFEESLRLERDRAIWLARFPDENPNPVARVSADGKVLYHNPAAASHPGWNCHLNESVQGPLLALVRQAMEQKHEMQTDVSLGGRFYSVSVMPFPEDHYANLYGRDVTERRQTENALREAEERFRIALSNSAITVFLTDKDLRYIWFHSSAVGTFPEQLLGKRDDEILAAENVASLIALKQRVIAERKTIKDEISLDLGSGKLVMIASIEPYFDEEGLLLGVIGSLFDITEQRRLELESIAHQTEKEVQRRLLEFRELERQEIARDLHDGPVQDLSSLIFNLQFAKEAIEDPAIRLELEQVRASLKESVQELRGMINDLRPPSLIRFGLAKSIGLHAEDFQESHPELTIHLQLEALDEVMHFPERVNLALFRIYQEAFNNVVRHAQATRVEVRFAQTAGQVVLAIEDNGKGFVIPEGLIDLTSDKHFGIAGIEERARAINGELVISSTPGKGTTVEVRIPIP